ATKPAAPWLACVAGPGWASSTRTFLRRSSRCQAVLQPKDPAPTIKMSASAAAARPAARPRAKAAVAAPACFTKWRRVKGVGVGTCASLEIALACRSSEQVGHNVAADVGEPEVAALEPVRQLGVVDPQAVQHGGVQVVDVDGVLDDVVPEVVGLAVGDAGLDAAAGQPHGKAARVVVA